MKSPLPAGTVVIWLAASIGAAHASAQGTNDQRISVAAAAGIANPLHSDLQFKAPAFQLGVRFSVSPLVAVEATYAEWRKSNEVVHEHIQAQGPSGLLGTIDRLTEDETYATHTVGWNVLLRHSTGRTTFWGGGGPAFMVLNHRYKQISTGCTGTVNCHEFGTTHTAGAFAVQGTAGMDVRLTGRLAAFGQYAFALPIEDPGSGHVGVSGGVRMRLW